MASSSYYDDLRSLAHQTNKDAHQRVEVNQRALIDKILARYAAKHAVFRELLANSNDAEAVTAEICFTTVQPDDGGAGSPMVESVVYRNNGMQFRSQDWARLQKIAEGNPDVGKVGAFGVGSYAMFSICEEPLVISGDKALLFTWKNDSLWTKTVEQPEPETSDDDGENWTCFVLKMREPERLPNLVQFGQFLCKNLTFTESLCKIRVLVDDQVRLVVQKTMLQEPKALGPPPQYESGDDLTEEQQVFVTETPKGIFSLDVTAPESSSIMKTTYEVSVQLDDEMASIEASYISAKAETCLPPELVTEMERVTKKLPPETVTVQLLQPQIQSKTSSVSKSNSKAARIVRSFVPSHPGSGRIFIGFPTTQTSGLAAHLGAPFFPTVEREAMDLQSPALRCYNLELLSLCGVVLRLSLEQSMEAFGKQWMEINKTQTEQEEMAETAIEMEQSELRPKSATFCDDTAPLTEVERKVVLLVKSFCPRESTPEPLVGDTIVKAFTECRPKIAPPVLTRSGVVSGDRAKVPHQLGLEKFVTTNVVRPAVYELSTEYHIQVAGCKPLQLEDLQSMLSTHVLDADQLSLFLKWWAKGLFAFQHGHVAGSAHFWENAGIRFALKKQGGSGLVVYELNRFNQYNTLNLDEALPLPDFVLPKEIQDKVGLDTLQSPCFSGVWSALTMKGWVSFISRHPCMNPASADTALRLKVLAAMSQAHSRFWSPNKRSRFGMYCRDCLKDVECVPYDDGEDNIKFGRPSHLFLRSVVVKFKNMHNVSEALKAIGVSDAFLQDIGVRSDVTVKCLLLHLDDLDWGRDPKKLLEYLCCMPLTSEDYSELRQKRYLPASNDKSRLFAPHELYFPRSGLSHFPTIRQLDLPAHDDTQQYRDVVELLRALNMPMYPPVALLLRYISAEIDQDREGQFIRLNLICKNLNRGGPLYKDYVAASGVREMKFLPCVKADLLRNETSLCAESPKGCYMDRGCSVMGFPVIDPELSEEAHLVAERFQCSREPTIFDVIRRFDLLVEKAREMTKCEEFDNSEELCCHVVEVFGKIFDYLSQRASELTKTMISSLRRTFFIPCRKANRIEWARPRDVLFQSDASDPTAVALFHYVEDNRFLGVMGVKDEPTSFDLLRLLVESPEDVMEKLGGDDTAYTALLRRVATNRRIKPTSTISDRRVGDTAFLLAYTRSEGNEADNSDHIHYTLAKPSEIYVIDNSLFGQMFSVPSAPREFDLEAFYASLGSKYISKEVNKKFSVDRPIAAPACTVALRKTINERRPLLVSPSITSRPLVDNAVSLLDENELEMVQSESIVVVYSLGRVLKTLHKKKTTCCVKPSANGKHTMYVTENFDWFDVGLAIGEVILKRCHVEDAFFIGALLETPLDRLRCNGFPVGQVIVGQKSVRQPVDSPLPSFSGSLLAAAQSAASQVASLGNTHKEADGDNKEDSSWFGGTSAMSLFRSTVEQRTIVAEETPLSEPLLDKEPSTGLINETSEEMVIDDAVELETEEKNPELPQLPQGATTASGDHDVLPDTTEEHEGDGSNEMTSILDWL